MARHPHPVSALVDHVRLLGESSAGRAAAAGWASQELALAVGADPSDLARACAAAGPAYQDRILAALLRVAAGDQLAQLTAVACAARRLYAVSARWARAGVPVVDRAVMEADLVAECWAAVSELAEQAAAGQPIPDRIMLCLVDAAVEAVRVPRRRERRRADREAPLHRDVTGEEPARTAADQLALELAGAVRAGVVSAAAIRPVFLTRVAGFDVTETARRMGCTPGVVRALRSRAERRLVAA